MSDMEITIPHEIFATKLCLCAHDLRHDFVQKSDRVQLSLSGINEPFLPLKGGGNSSLLHPQDYEEHTLYSSTDNNMAVLIAEHFYKETLNELFTSKNTSDIVAQKVEEKMSEFKKTLDAYDPMVSESRRPATPEIAEKQDTTGGIERQSTTVGPAPVRFERQSTTVGPSVPGTPKKRALSPATTESTVVKHKQGTPGTPVATATTPERLQPTKRQRSEQVVERSTGMAGGGGVPGFIGSPNIVPQEGTPLGMEVESGNPSEVSESSQSSPGDDEDTVLSVPSPTAGEKMLKAWQIYKHSWKKGQTFHL